MTDYRQAARRAAQRAGIDPDIFERQIGAESGFNPNARSPAGATGIAQIMPATARGWGVDPNNPIAALNAAARNMKRYVNQFGNYGDALRAYNAGPGNVARSRTFAETNAYVSKILGGHNPTAPASTNAADTTASPTSDAYASSQRQLIKPAVDRSADRLQLAMSFLSKRGNDPLSFAQGVKQRADTPAEYATSRTVGLTTPTAGAAASPSATPAAGQGPLRELFWQGPGGINIKDGQRVPQGFVSGHTDHVHVASGPQTTVELGKLAQSMGLHVGENPHFGGVHPVHVKGSYHYRGGGEAIDVSGDPRLMARYAATVARRYGVKR